MFFVNMLGAIILLPALAAWLVKPKIGDIADFPEKGDAPPEAPAPTETPAP
jgi:hypothetical protein